MLTFTKYGSSLPWLRSIIDNLQDGSYEIRPYTKPRNLDQNALYHSHLGWIEKETGNDHAFLHEMMKKKFLSVKKLVKLGNKRNYVTKVGSTTKLSKKAFSEYYEKVDRFFCELGYVLPPHDKNIEDTTNFISNIKKW